MLRILKIDWILTLLIISASLPSKSQDLLSRDEMASDLEFLHEALVNGHPNPFLYITPDSLDRLFSSQIASLPLVLPRLAFESRVRACVASVHCIHTSILKSKATGVRRYMPISVVVRGNRAWIISSAEDADIWKPGTELMAINGRKVSEVIPTLKSFQSGDGPSGSFEEELLSQEYNFSAVYGRFFPEDTTFLIEAKTAGRKVFIRSIPGYTRASFLALSPTPKSKKKPSSYTFYRDSINESIAVLKISAFLGNPASDYRKCFKSLSKDSAQVLVIDLRGNLGGNIYYGDELLSYVMERPWKTYVGARVGQKSWQYLDFTGKIKRVMTAARYTGLVLMQQTRYKPGNGFQFSFTPRKRRHYDGPLVVLTDGFTASTSTVVTSYLYHSQRATIVGRPSGGGDCGNSGLSYPRVELPTSKILVRWPYFWIDYAESQACAGSIVPDFPIHYSLQDMIEGKDLDLDWVRVHYE